MKRFVAFIIITLVLGGIGYVLLGQLGGERKSFDIVGSPLPGEAPGAPEAFKTNRNRTSVFDDAKIAFQTPNVMQVGKSKDVALVLSLKKSIAELKKQLGEEFPTGGASIKGAPIMEASLSGAAFDIRASNPSRQAIREDGDTTWEWSVVPRERGSHTLKLRLYAIVTRQGTSAPLEVKSFERDIPVEVSLPELIISFAKNNMQLIWLALVVPIAGFLSRFFKGGKASAVE